METSGFLDDACSLLSRIDEIDLGLIQLTAIANDVKLTNWIEPKLGQLTGGGSEWNFTVSPVECFTFAASQEPITISPSWGSSPN